MDQDDLQKLFNITSKEISKNKAKYYDDEISTPVLKIAKAIVPYLDLKSQKQFGIIIKIIEIQRLYDLYAQKDLQKGSNQTKDINNTKNNFDSAIINIIKAYFENAQPNKQSQKNLSQASSQENNSKTKNNIEPDIILNNKNKILEQNKNIFDFDYEVFKDLSENDINFLKKFLDDITNKTFKSPIEIFNIMTEYNQKMPKNFGDKQKNIIIKSLIKKLSPDKQKQFLYIYKTFFNEK